MSRQRWVIAGAIIASSLGWGVAASAQDPKPVIRTPAPTTRITKPDSGDARATPGDPARLPGAAAELFPGAAAESESADADVTGESAIGLSPEPTVTEGGPTESGPDVTCTITASRDLYENLPIPHNGMTIFGPSDQPRVWFHTRRRNLGGSSFPNAWAQTQIMVNGVVIKEVPTLFNMEEKDCQNCLPVQKSSHAVDLPLYPFVPGLQVEGRMENDIHNAVAESNETNNGCGIKFTAQNQGGGNEPLEVY